MISPKYFMDSLKEFGVDFFAGVPDSLLKDICAYITDHSPKNSNIITVNEGAAVGLAIGYHLATRKIPAVYMQNSGLGNAINPLISLADKDIYNIPVLLIVGWRGEPNTKDEPQHIKQGKITIPLLDTMGIKADFLSDKESTLKNQVGKVLSYMKKTNESFALIVRKNTFESYKMQDMQVSNCFMTREDAIKTTVNSMHFKDIIVSTTGMISRELFEYRDLLHHEHHKDFLTIGGMGHASQIALGIALNRKDRKVFCFDGDGAILMHMGSMATLGTIRPDNYIHVLFNNGSHDSVGGQPTVGLKVDIPQIALSCGYTKAFSTNDQKSLQQILNKIKLIKGTIFLEIKVKKGARKDLGRPTIVPVQNKESFMDFL
jgi:phosphonopyruvate decarboxylase